MRLISFAILASAISAHAPVFALCEPKSKDAASMTVIGGTERVILQSRPPNVVLMTICVVSVSGPAKVIASTLSRQPGDTIPVGQCLTTAGPGFVRNDAGGTLANLKYCIEAMQLKH